MIKVIRFLKTGTEATSEDRRWKLLGYAYLLVPTELFIERFIPEQVLCLNLNSLGNSFILIAAVRQEVETEEITLSFPREVYACSHVPLLLHRHPQEYPRDVRDVIGEYREGDIAHIDCIKPTDDTQALCKLLVTDFLREEEVI